MTSASVVVIAVVIYALTALRARWVRTRREHGVFSDLLRELESLEVTPPCRTGGIVVPLRRPASNVIVTGRRLAA